MSNDLEMETRITDGYIKLGEAIIVQAIRDVRTIEEDKRQISIDARRWLFSNEAIALCDGLGLPPKRLLSWLREQR